MSGSWYTSIRQNWVGIWSDGAKVTGWTPISSEQRIGLCFRTQMPLVLWLGAQYGWSQEKSECKWSSVICHVHWNKYQVRMPHHHGRFLQGHSVLVTCLNVKGWQGMGGELLWVPWLSFLGHPHWNFKQSLIVIWNHVLHWERILFQNNLEV